MITEFITKLTNVLEQENAIYQDILEMSKNKTDIIIEGRVSELESIIKLEQNLIVQLGKLEDVRETLVSEISSHLKIPIQELKLSDLINYADKKEADKLKNCQKRMSFSLKDLMNVNELNSNLIKNSLEYIDFSINILSKPDIGINNYGNTGQVSSSEKRNFLDVRL
jgi:predicted AAA+ superfamily ATPase